MELARLAFLETYALENGGGIMGAILVTDKDTKPLEFRVTAPIKPTNFQKTLYGNVLKEHILVELISVPLINAVNENIDLIIVQDPLFLGVNEKQDIRVVRLFKDEKEKTNTGEKGEALTQFVNGTTKVFIETWKQFSGELPEIKDMLDEISANRNLIEPFERLKVACEQVHLQKTSD